MLKALALVEASWIFPGPGITNRFLSDLLYWLLRIYTHTLLNSATQLLIIAIWYALLVKTFGQDGQNIRKPMTGSSWHLLNVSFTLLWCREKRFIPTSYQTLHFCSLSFAVKKRGEHFQFITSCRGKPSISPFHMGFSLNQLFVAVINLNVWNLLPCLINFDP